MHLEGKGAAQIKRRCGHAVCALLWTACATQQPEVVRYTAQARAGRSLEVVRVSSYYATVTHLVAALARGEVALAMSCLSTLTALSVGKQQAIIYALTHFFDEGNQLPGRCGDVPVVASGCSTTWVSTLAACSRTS